MEHSSDRNHKIIETYWSSQAPIFTKLYTQGATTYVQSLQNLEAAFHENDRTLRCIDERTPGGIHLAGSGILLPEDEIEHVVKRLKKEGVEGVWSHAHCGAAALYAQQNNLDMEKGDEYGKEWADTFAKRLGVPYLGHIDSDQLSGPAEFHIARVAYYVGSSHFDPSRVEGLPPGFVINRGYLSPKYAKFEADLSVKIATGEHGFGRLITKETPFLLIVVADLKDQSASLKQLKAELSPIEHASGGRVRVDGFTAPI